ncbi:MAG: hypothetical protein ACOYLB_07170 [Phototrophicaceae bacterium]
MIYEIHLFVPKREKLTPTAVRWLFENGTDPTHPEPFWPVYKLRPKALARLLLRFDPQLIPIQGVGNDVELHYPDQRLGIILYTHDRGVIFFFPYMSYSQYSRIVLGICYTYIHYLEKMLGMWAYDPQLEVITSESEYRSLEVVALMMDRILPQHLSSGDESA